jgi:hypothetical protein
MAARLEWIGAELRMGPFCVGRVVANKKEKTHHGVVEAYGKWSVEQTPYQSIVDCMQDLESEVRQILKDSGVDL